MKSTLIELPPELSGLEEDSIEYVDAQSKDELAQRGNIQDEAVKNRLLLPGQQFGPYSILGFIAAGGMGEVYAAERNMEDGRKLGPVALKVISPEYRDDWAITARFKREAQISRAIRSTHVTRVYEFGQTDDGHMFLAMELLQGEELFERMYTTNFTPAKVVEIMLEMLAGLAAVHDSGFIHRDLKPENVYFCRRDDLGTEVIKILDFGIAKVKDQKSDPYLSVVGKIYGTPEYISPEQGLNPDVDHRSDLYSAGVMLYELLAGMLPFDGESSYAIILAHQNQKPPRLPGDIDSELNSIVQKALAKKPEDRYQSAQEMSAALRAWQDRQSGVFVEAAVPETGERKRLQTPNRPQETPLGGVPRAESDSGSKGGLIGLDELADEPAAPPVQIFSKPKRQKPERRRRSELPPLTPPGLMANDSKERAALRPGEPATASSQPAREEEHESSALATVVTMMVVLIIIAAAVFAYLN